MPNWQSIDEAYARLMSVRDVFDDVFRLAVDHRNAGALPVLEILSREVEQLMRELLHAFAPVATVD